VVLILAASALFFQMPLRGPLVPLLVALFMVAAVAVWCYRETLE
jgi:hypothetical protein